MKLEGARLDTRRDPMLKRMEELDASVQSLAKREAAALATRQAAADRVEGLKNQVATAYSVCRTLVAKVDLNKQSDAQASISVCAIPFNGTRRIRVSSP